MHERRFKADVERLRSPERVARLEVERVVELCLAELTAKDMLDVGTGSGLFAEAFASHGLDVHGIDVNPDMVEIAQHFVPGGQFKTAPAEAIPYPAQSFDLVFLGLVLHEADDYLQALQEAQRVTRARVAALEWPYREEPFNPPLAHRLQPEKVTALAEQAGFSRVEILPLTHTVLYRLHISALTDTQIAS